MASDQFIDIKHRLRDLALKYARCRHGQENCNCTTEALAELGRLSLGAYDLSAPDAALKASNAKVG